ncbi:MAG: Eco57I restriction-modification methylase domain-containing protein [Elusimicrobia bacterium]|nr:Eco57I restriction-modification methylase domain-containing protein [Elusimicrobiota bacterium]
MNLSLHIPKAAYAYGKRSSGETHGVVLTKPHIVELILDLAGYTANRDLTDLRLLEPSCGTGAFLIKAVERLMKSAKRRGVPPERLADCIDAFDIDTEHVAASRLAVETELKRCGTSRQAARKLAEKWVKEADFLLSSDGPYDAVVGNPPYIRIENLAPILQSEYRRRYASLYDRADLYVAFIEHSLNLLRPDGVLSFVCADRWVLNRYGSPLRRMISERFNVRCYIDLHQASPFESEVIAYPSIFSISAGAAAPVQVSRLQTASPHECASLSAVLQGKKNGPVSPTVVHYKSWFSGDEPWVLSPPEHLKALRELEAKFRPIEANAKVHIGVATGNDSVYIVDRSADIEPDRLVPLVMRADIEEGSIKDAGRRVINTFEPSGEVIDLKDYPRLRKHFEAHGIEIRKRHVAQKNPKAWFRTIDRVYPELVKVPKLLIPDIAGSNEIAFDEGRYHPHHNLYFVTSDCWDMEVLGGLLSSKVALLFIWSYAVKMRGSYFRFQAQYLRRIRLPEPSSLAPQLAQAIKTVFRKRDFEALDSLSLRAFGLKSLPPFSFVDTRR